MFGFFLERFEPRVAINGDRLAVTFAAFAIAIPCSGGGADIIWIGNRIENANRRGRYFVSFALVVVAMHVCNSESADVFGGTLRFISDPALRRFRQNRKQFLIIDRLRHQNRFVLRVRCPEHKAGEQCQHQKSDVCRRTNASRCFHTNSFLCDSGLPYPIDFTSAVKTLAGWTYASGLSGALTVFRLSLVKGEGR